MQGLRARAPESPPRLGKARGKPIHTPRQDPRVPPDQSAGPRPGPGGMWPHAGQRGSPGPRGGPGSLGPRAERPAPRHLSQTLPAASRSCPRSRPLPTCRPCSLQRLKASHPPTQTHPFPPNPGALSPARPALSSAFLLKAWPGSLTSARSCSRPPRALRPAPPGTPGLRPAGP